MLKRSSEEINTYASACYNVVAIIISLLFTILLIITPPAVDDLLFMSDVRDIPAITDRLAALPEMLLQRWQTETGRLGNLICITAIYLLPRWIVHIFTGAAIYLILRLLPRVSCVRPGSFISTLLLAVFVFLFPWYDSLFQISYSINYIWGALLAIFAIMILIPRSFGETTTKQDNLVGVLHPCRIFSSRHTTLCCLICFFAGWTHEAYGAPLCAATFFLYLIYRPKGIKPLLPFLFLIIGTALTFTSPIFLHRLLCNVESGQELKILQFPISELLMQLGPALLMFTIFLLSLTISLILATRKKTNFPSEIHGIVIFYIAATFTALAIFLLYYTGARTGTSLILFSAIGAAFMLNQLPIKASRLLSGVALIFISIAAIVNLITAIISESRLRQEYYEIERLYSQSPSGEIYFDLTYPKPDLSLFKTGVFHFHQKIPLWMWATYYGHDAPLTILPKALAGFTPTKSRISVHPKPNESEDGSGVWIYNGCIVISPSEAEKLKVNAITHLPFEIAYSQNGASSPITDDRTIIKESRFRLSEFTGDDGRRYVYIEPHIKVLDNTIQLHDIYLPDLP